jgi:hypothetical protein
VQSGALQRAFVYRLADDAEAAPRDRNNLAPSISQVSQAVLPFFFSSETGVTGFFSHLLSVTPQLAQFRA